MREDCAFLRPAIKELARLHITSITFSNVGTLHKGDSTGQAWQENPGGGLNNLYNLYLRNTRYITVAKLKRLFFMTLVSEMSSNSGFHSFKMYFFYLQFHLRNPLCICFYLYSIHKIVVSLEQVYN